MRDLRGELEQDDGKPTPAWKPEVGDILVGKILRFESVTLRAKAGEGPRRVVVAIVADEKSGTEIGIWVSTTSLIEAFEEQRPMVGDRIGVKRLPAPEGVSYKRFRLMVETGAGGQPYPSSSAPRRATPSFSPDPHEPPPHTRDDNDIPF